MKTSEILQLDYREQESKEIIQKVLRLIKPLSKYADAEEIPFVGIEKAVQVMSAKYIIRLRDITPDYSANPKYPVYRATIIDDTDLSSYQVYGISLYEVLAKVAIAMYSTVRAGVDLRNGGNRSGKN